MAMSADCLKYFSSTATSIKFSQFYGSCIDTLIGRVLMTYLLDSIFNINLQQMY